MTVGNSAGELVGDGQAQQAQGHLVFRINGEYVAADGFCLFRLVQIAVVFCLGQRLGNTALRDGLELAFHWLQSPEAVALIVVSFSGAALAAPKIFFTSRRMGS